MINIDMNFESDPLRQVRTTVVFGRRVSTSELQLIVDVLGRIVKVCRDYELCIDSQLKDKPAVTPEPASPARAEKAVSVKAMPKPAKAKNKDPYAPIN